MLRRIVAIIAALLSAFFIFYSLRLLFVTGFLRHVRQNGNGAYIGAVVFPVLAVAFGWIAIRAWRRSSADHKRVN